MAMATKDVPRAARRYHARRPVEPKQDRSRATQDAILDAAEQVFDGRDLASISIRELTMRAGVSTSSLYARFPDKESLLRATLDRVIEKTAVNVQRLRSEDWSERSLRDLARVAIQTYVAGYSRWGGVIQTALLAARTDPALLRAQKRLDRMLIREVTEVAIEIHPRLGLAREILEPMIIAVAAGARALVQRPDLFEKAGDTWSDERVEALAAMSSRNAVDLLGTADPDRPAP